MVSLHNPKQKLSDESFSWKRKMEGPADEEKSQKPSDHQIKQTWVFSTDWQRCLDLKSGHIYYYNSRTNKRALADFRSSPPEQHRPGDAGPLLSLELQFNLPFQSDSGKHDPGETLIHPNRVKDDMGLTRSPSCLTFEVEQHEIEMMTAVCNKCYMLVMMCRSTPSCPNCKFVHTLEIKEQAFLC